MDKKILKTIKNISITLIVICIIFSFIVSQDTHHLEICHEEHCAICVIICIAQNIVSISIVIVLYLYVGFLIYFFLAKLVNKIKINSIQKSLIFQKVQFNE